MFHNIMLPQLLVASPLIEDPEFVRTMLLITNYDKNKGAVAFSLSRKMAIMPDYNEPLLNGGPVSTGDYFMTVHSADWRHITTSDACYPLFVSSMADVLEAVSSGSGPLKRTHFTGYAGFSPGELEQLIQDGVFIPIEFNEKYVFEIPPANRWEMGILEAGIKEDNVIHPNFGRN